MSYQDTDTDKCTTSGEVPQFKQGKSQTETLEYKIDSSKLEESLQKQIQDDRNYWLQNEVKIRAVSQGSLTYDDFRNLVASAHLKPLSKEDQEVFQKTRSTVLWNSLADVPNEKLETLSLLSDSSTKNTLTAEDQNKFSLPKTTTDFLKIWKNLETANIKILYLFQLLKLTSENDKCDHINLNKVSCMEKLFKEEVPPQVFPEIINHLITFVSDEMNVFSPGLVEYMDCLGILLIMSNSKRFQLTMNFLSESDRNNVNKLVQILNDVLSKPDIMPNNSEDKDQTSSEYTQEKVLTLLQTVGNHYYHTSNHA